MKDPAKRTSIETKGGRLDLFMHDLLPLQLYYKQIALQIDRVWPHWFAALTEIRCNNADHSV